MLADLHLHTHFSDSSRSPEALVAAVRAAGIGLIAVCDHDTTAAYAQLHPLCEAAGIRLIQGVEISSHWNGLELHILGLGFDAKHPAIRDVLAHNQAEYAHHDEVLIRNLAADYPQISPQDFAAFPHPIPAGGWKNTNYCMARGLIDTNEARIALYSHYASHKLQFLSTHEACDAISQSGGVPILAHPGNYWPTAPQTLESTLDSLVNDGIRGIECFYPSHSDTLRTRCLDYCTTHSLCITAGSDDHGEFNRIIDGVEYALGVIHVDEIQLLL